MYVGTWKMYHSDGMNCSHNFLLSLYTLTIKCAVFMMMGVVPQGISHFTTAVRFQKSLNGWHNF